MGTDDRFSTTRIAFEPSSSSRSEGKLDNSSMRSILLCEVERFERREAGRFQAAEAFDQIEGDAAGQPRKAVEALKRFDLILVELQLAQRGAARQAANFLDAIRAGSAAAAP